MTFNGIFNVVAATALLDRLGLARRVRHKHEASNMRLSFSLAAVGGWFITKAFAQNSHQTYQMATNELGRIRDLTNNLTDAVAAWDGTDLQTALSNIHNPAEGTVEYITNATEKLQNHDITFGITQAFRIATPTQRLAYAVNASVATLNRRKDDFEAADIGTIVISDLQNLLNTSKTFAETLISYVPMDLRPVADNLKSQTIESLQQGIDCFNGTTSACSTVIVDPDRTYELAVRYDAMKRDGSPIA